MARIERSVEINASPTEVFELLTDLDRLSQWATVAGETENPPDKPLRTGQSWQHGIRVGGMTITADWRVAGLEAPRYVEYEVTAPGDGRMNMKQRISPTQQGSLVELEIDYELPGGLLGQLADRVYVERRNEREAESSLQNLKDLLEGRPVSS